MPSLSDEAIVEYDGVLNVAPGPSTMGSKIERGWTFQR